MATSGLWHSDDDEWGRNSVSRESRDSSDDSSSDEEQADSVSAFIGSQ